MLTIVKFHVGGYPTPVRKSIALFIIIMIGALPIINMIPTSTGATNSLVVGGHVQPLIWSYENIKIQPENALILNLQQQEWQASVASCVVPAFIDRKCITPIMFDDGTENRDIEIPHNTANVMDFGADQVSATAEIATTYWSKAEIVIVTDTYEHILWAVPIASFLSAPILINPSIAILQNLGTKCIIEIGEMVGEATVDVDQRVKLLSKEEVWSFQLELFDTKGQVCNYIIVTNPYDTAQDENIKWKFLSLASASLAAYRHAIVQTNNYTGDRAKIDAIASANKKLGETYKKIKPYFEKVKNDTYYAAKFLIDREHNPEFLALVGGSYALPDYYFDYHVRYYYWSAKIDYIASSAPYANLTNNLTYETYPHEELGVGRIVGHSLLDTTNLLMRTYSYNDFLPNGKFANLTPTSWENNSCIIEGHRLNQPNSGGPPALNNEPYHPAGEVDNVFQQSGYNETYYLPRNVTNSNDTNIPIDDVIDHAFSSSSMILINAHGGVPGEQALLEIGIDPFIGKEYLFTLDEKEVIKRQLVPSVVYVIACETGTTAVDISMDDYIALGFIHSGSVAYIAPDTYQTICFWDKAPDGPEATQTVNFFQKLLSENIPIGWALSAAKWKSYEQWKNDTSFADDVAGITLHLYGDPAFKPHKPNVLYPDKKRFDVLVIHNGKIKAGSSFDVTASITNFDSNLVINDAKITITFQDHIVNGNNAKFIAPDNKGSYQLIITVHKEGYEDCTARYWIYVPESKNNYLIPIGVVAIVLVIAMVISMNRYYNKTKLKQEEEMDDAISEQNGLRRNEQ